MSRRIRLGINGFGRIGRCVARLAAQSDEFEIAAVNDLAADVANLAYLYNYDSTYGRPRQRAEADPVRSAVTFGAGMIPFFHQASSVEVPWSDSGIDVLVDATGVADNIAANRKLVDAGTIKYVILTHAPESGADRHIIMGVNDGDFAPERDRVISASICDANAIAHPLRALEKRFGIESGFVTTLHPWLSYQNLVDAPVAWQSRPGLFWADFSLGRMSTGTLIPKGTTAVSVLRPVLPETAAKLAGFSYRTPTHIVCSADITLRLSSETTGEELTDFLVRHFEGSPYVGINFESLVGIDYLGDSRSAVIDAQWLQVLQGNMVRIVLWYDNEFAYGNRVLDIARLVSRSPNH